MGAGERTTRGSLGFISRIGERHVLVFYGFLGNFIAYCMRLTISMAIIQMVQHDVKNETSHDTCPSSDNITAFAKSEQYKQGDFNWTSETEHQVLGSFYYGYFFSQIPSGWVAGFYSPKKLYAYAIGSCAIFTILIPPAAWTSSNALIAMRILQGLAQGVSYPLLSTMFGRWAPPSERTRMLAITSAGTSLGTIIVLPVSSAIGMSLGWEAIFYIFGAFGLVFPFVWWFYISDSPEEHPRITAEEKSYIISSIGGPAMGAKAAKVPWGKVVRSMKVWSIVIIWWCGDWGFYTLLSDVPLWLNGNLHFDLKSNGGISALPYLFMFAVVCGFPGLCDYVIKRKYLSYSGLRKVTTGLGTLVPAAFLVGLGFAGCNKARAVAILCLSVATSGFGNMGYRINFNDLSPTHAGILVAIANTVGTASGFVSPMVTAYFTSEARGGHRNSNWRNVFAIAAGQYAVGCIIYSIFGSGEMQQWDSRSGVRASLEEKIAPETIEDEGLPAKLKSKASIQSWIPPATGVTDGVKEVIEKRRRSSIPPWVANQTSAVEGYLAQTRRKSMLHEPLTVIVEPTSAMSLIDNSESKTNLPS